jgi:hypothetical protein
MPEEVSDLSYDFKKMLESCPQELWDGLPIPVFRGIIMRFKMKIIATNCMPEVVSDSPYDIMKMLESCPQGAS